MGKETDGNRERPGFKRPTGCHFPPSQRNVFAILQGSKGALLVWRRPSGHDPVISSVCLTHPRRDPLRRNLCARPFPGLRRLVPCRGRSRLPPCTAAEADACLACGPRISARSSSRSQSARDRMDKLWSMPRNVTDRPRGSRVRGAGKACPESGSWRLRPPSSPSPVAQPAEPAYALFRGC